MTYMGERMSKRFGLPVKECSCPSCGLVFGHHKTQVDLNTQECTWCVNKALKAGDYKHEKPTYMDAYTFVFENT